MSGSMPSVGASARVAHQVTDADLACTLGTGNVPVLASSRLLTWSEDATCAAISAELDESQTTVGTKLKLEHEQPSPLDTTVFVRATLAQVDGRLLVFEVQAEHDDGEVVGHGEVTRVVVNRERFLKRTAPGS